ncbi:LysR family transcriptional regulator [Neorhizobium huautlense]|uniref:LysR family transcriptional regulator n=1 Tax=Neorhizobium huautlense TaxID=67774 RepID=UPI000CF9343C|nr:LysR family transcriptional regulator [Neorhizobium huautlense]
MNKPACGWKTAKVCLRSRVSKCGNAARQRYMPNLASIDLNLLVVLEALLEYRNVTRAAHQVGRTQPATSRALARLRGMFNDDLLVRASTGMVPTPVGKRLAEMLPSALHAISEIVTLRSSAPPERRSKAMIMIPDHQALLLLPRLLPRLCERDIHLDIITDPLLGEAASRLEQGEIDFAIGQIGAAPPGYMRRSLYGDRFACLVRHDHPAVAKGWTRENFASLRHAAIAANSNRGFGLIYDDLTRLSLPDQDPMLFSDVLTAAAVISATDMVLIVPHLVATRLAAMLPLTVVDPPVQLPAYEVELIWHERCHHDPSHSWLRREIAAVLNGRIEPSTEPRPEVQLVRSRRNSD